MKNCIENINYIFQSIAKAGLFSEWTEILASKRFLDKFSALLKGKEDACDIGTSCFKNNIPFLIIYEFTIELLKHCDSDKVDSGFVINTIAKNYLDAKLKNDLIFLEKKEKESIPYATQEQKELINQHIFWIMRLINALQNGVSLPEMDKHKCFIGKWLEENDCTLNDYRMMIKEKHELIHTIAESTIRMFELKKYSNFLLLFNDLLHHSLELQSIFLNIHFEKQLVSMDKDPLTNLANYFQLKYDIEEKIKNKSLMVINIESFSKINIIFGHKVGDALIKELAEEIKNNPNVLKAYRIYGDDFAILLDQKNDVQTATKIIQALESRAYCVESEANVSISLYGSIGHVDNEILARNEYGLILSKDNNQKLVNVNNINTEYINQYAQNMEIARNLRLSFMEDHVVPYFQPIFNIKTNRIEKYEALMRIKQPDNSVIIPGGFMEVLRNMYIYPEFTKTMVKKTFEFFADKDYHFAINLSFKDLMQQDTKDFIFAVLNKYPISAKRCTFELLEYEAVTNFGDVAAFFEALHSFGVKIALDDFGAGYSNYVGVFNFNIDYIKIDGSITENLLYDKKAQIITESIMLIAKKLNVKVVAEFVSSKELFDEIQKYDIDFAQGYYIGKPSANI